jgi:hypothetical protein
MIPDTPPDTPDTPIEAKEEILTDYIVAKKLIQLKQSADSRGIEFDLSFIAVKKLMNAKVCFYTRRRFGEDLDARSIDRVDSSIGYVDGNVVACTVDINRKKANLTHDEILLLSDRIQHHRSKCIADSLKKISKELSITKN